MSSVAIICAYFGKLPGCFETWLKSCAYNPSIDFLLFTDQEVEKHPANVRIYKVEFRIIQKLADDAMKQHVSLEYPYKLCDLKPMYGLFFHQYLQGYDYWGHCDMDLVFGDIRSYLDRYELDKYDKFLDLGHLSLYRNTDENNSRFKNEGSRCGSWEEVITEQEGHAFDERNGIYQIYKINGYTVFDQRIYADIATVHKRFRCALDDINYDQQVFYWENGKTYRDYWLNGERRTEEFIYIHFKKRDFQAPLFDSGKVNAFYIGPDGFTEKAGETTLELVSHINPFKGRLNEGLEVALFKCKKLKGSIVRKLKSGGMPVGK